MKKTVFRILVCVLILSLALTAASKPVLAEVEEPHAPTPAIPDWEGLEILPDKFEHDHHLIQEHPYPPEFEEMFPGEEEMTEPREYIPPSPEVVAKTQEQVQSFSCATVTDVPQIECEALVALYNSTNGAGWTYNTNWLVTPTVDDWYRVGVESRHVASIGLYNNNLNGSIPPELGNLTNLVSLQLYNNRLSGSIPLEIGNLSNLTKLYLYSNQFSGSIPSQLGNLTNLVELRLDGNLLVGSIPTSLGNLTKLVYFSLAGNALIGNIPLELGNLVNLEYLYLRFNNLSGVIPSTFGNLAKLKYLSLQDNQLVGEIPSEIGNLTQLEGLELAYNNLTGQIPSELGQLTNLTGLWMGVNQLSGPIPLEIFGLTNLDSLGLWDNYLTGSIPPEIGNLLSLTTLWLNNNYLSGSIPQEIGLLTNLQYLDIKSNRFNGDLPDEVGNLINLTQFDISKNQFSGDVPASFTNLVNLCVSGNPDWPCYGMFDTDLGYNRLNVPAPEPPASFLAIKDPDWYLTQAVEEDIPGDTGGTVVSNDGNTEVDIPAGAVEGTLSILFAPQPNPSENIGALNFAGNSFELTASIGEVPVTTFSQPLTLTLQYDQASLGVIPEDSLILYYWDTVQLAWVDAASTCEGGTYMRNLDEDWLSLPICHLSEFALLGDSFDLFLPSIRR